MFSLGLRFQYVYTFVRDWVRVRVVVRVMNSFGVLVMVTARAFVCRGKLCQISRYRDKSKT